MDKNPKNITNNQIEILQNELLKTKQSLLLSEKRESILKKNIDDNNEVIKELNKTIETLNETFAESTKKQKKVELRFRSMSESIPFGVFVCNSVGENIFVNSYYCKLTGQKYDEALGTGWLKAIHPSNLVAVQKRWQSSLKKSPMHFNMIYKIFNRQDKKTYEIHSTVKEMVHNNKLLGFVGVVENITKEKRLIDKLKNYKLIISNSFEMMSLISRDFEYIAVNDSYVKAHGLKKYQIVGKTFEQLWGKELYEKKIKKKLEEVFSGKVVRYQDWFDFENLGRRYMDVIYQPVFGNRGKVKLITVNTLDITDLKETQMNHEKAVVEAEKANKAKSEFLANMSHEIRTPLNAVIGFTELLESQITDNKQKKYLGSVKAGGRSLLTLINDILDLSKIEAGKMELIFEPVHISYLIEEISQIFSIKIEEKSLLLETYIDPLLPNYVVIDEIRLRQILFNLVGNAIKFTKEGTIKIFVKLIKKEKSTIDLEINVEDTGIGIPIDQQTEIFRAFKQQIGQSTRKYGGTGLGLTISKKLVESMGGKISVESKVGEYAKFSINFTGIRVAASAKKKNLQGTIEEYDLIFEPANILVIDRVVENRDLIIANFADTNLNIIPASNAKSILNSNKLQKIDMVIVDVKFHDTEDCKIQELCQKLRQKSNTAIIAMSTSVISKERCKVQVDFNDYLIKPMKRVELLTTVSKFLKHKKTRKKEIVHEIPECKESLSKLSLKPEFEEIVKQIDEKLIPIWEKAIRDELSDDIERLSNELISFAEEHEIKILIKFANNLSDYLNSFDLEEMTKSLNQFPDIIKKIKGG